MHSPPNADEHTPLLEDVRGSTPEVPSPLKDGVTIPPVSLVAVVAPLMLGIFLVALDTTVITSTYATIGSHFHQLQNTSWIITGYMLSMASFQPLHGKLSDIFGRKSCLLCALSLFALGCLFCGLARNMTELIGARFLAGIGGGGVQTLSYIIMSDVAPLRQRGTLQGVFTIAWSTGQALGAPVGGLFAENIGWRWTFLLQIPIVLFAILSVALWLKLPHASTEDLRTKLARIDFAGAATLIAAIFLLLFGIDRGANVSWSDRLTIASLSASAVFIMLFSVVELQGAREPIAPKRIVTHPSLLAINLSNSCAFGVYVTLFFHTSLYLQAVQGAKPSDVGLIFLTPPPAGLIGSLGAGLIIQATGKYYVLSIVGLAVMLAGNVTTALITGPLGFTTVALIFSLFANSVGISATNTGTLVALVANAGPEDQAIATAVSFLFRSVGQVVWLSVGTTLTQNVLRHSLRKRLSDESADIDEIVARVRESMEYLKQLEPAMRAEVIAAYQDGIQAAMWFVVALATLSVFSAFWIREKPLAR